MGEFDTMRRFEERPNRELVTLAVPVLGALVAEPLTGFVDTAFVAALGTDPLAALGIATTLLSSTFWVFNFLGIGAQTEVATAIGARRPETARAAASAAISTAFVAGCAVALLVWPVCGFVADWMGATGETRGGVVTYLRIRILAAPAVLIATASAGVLRGRQDMKTPLRIALATNLANLALDPLLIFGAGPLPGLGLAGAASASALAQWGGASLALRATRRSVGWSWEFDPKVLRGLLRVGRDLFFRTGALMLFLILATRSAARIGNEAAAAHQVVRQVWLLSAFMLDAWATAAQSLVGTSFGAGRVLLARRVASTAAAWSLGTGIVLGVGMAGLTGFTARALVPTEAVAAFGPAWLAAAAAQPLNALSFVTDGVHWATKDYRYLRNAMLLATIVGAVGLFALDRSGASRLLSIWLVTAVWIAIRTAFGVVRVWPGIGRAPLARPSS